MSPAPCAIRSPAIIAGNALVVAALAAVLAGCAAPSDPQAEPRDAKVYRTGSNIPVRDAAASSAQTQNTDTFNAQRIPQMPPRLPGSP